MIKSKWPFEVEFIYDLDWNRYVMLLKSVSDIS